MRGVDEWSSLLTERHIDCDLKGQSTSNNSNTSISPYRLHRKRLVLSILSIGIFGIILACALRGRDGALQDASVGSFKESIPLLTSSSKTLEREKKEKHLQSIHTNVTERCDWVNSVFAEKNAGNSEAELRRQYAVQATDANVFYRATANIFWYDFVHNGWWERLKFENNGINAIHADGTPLQRRSAWTWVTGDQHLSNFGAWRNRHGDVVFSVNDFDEAIIFDFQVDVLRIAVSVCSHAHTNGLSNKDIKRVLRAFTDTYVDTLVNYVGGDKDLLFELTPQTAKGALKTYLQSVVDDKSDRKLIRKFTEKDEDGKRHFIRDENTRLVDVPSDIEQQIREQFTVTKYGATMMKMGWLVRSWDDDYFEIIDIARRVGSGVGSYGVDRYYVLLKGTDGGLQRNGEDGSAVILDVKFEPTPAFEMALNPTAYDEKQLYKEDRAWYDLLFPNEAARAVEAQRRLTSYVDPFTGWVTINEKAFLVRQRSPWKSSPDLDTLTDPYDFISFMEQVAVATATSHSRGTEAKSPGQFKHVIASALGGWSDRTAWGNAVADAAADYREQVLLDFGCFKSFVKENYSIESVLKDQGGADNNEEEAEPQQEEKKTSKKDEKSKKKDEKKDKKKKDEKI